MKKLMMIVLVACSLSIGYGFWSPALADSGVPARKLNGAYAITVHGSLVLCVQSSPPHAVAACGSDRSISVPLTAVAIGAYTSDADGACVTWTETDSESPLTIAPPAVYVVHQAAKTTSYDPETGTGDIAWTNYFGGTCHGAKFDDTAATAVSSGTSHFVASDDGKRIDTVATSLTTPGNIIGGFSISSTNLRQ